MDTAQKGGYKLRTLKISTIAISSVVFVEFTLGLLVGSLAILSDGAHALLDALTMIVLLLTTRASLKPPDEEHMYGHEKFEAIGGLVGGIALVGISLLIMYEAILRFTQNLSINLGFEFAGFIAIGYTLCIDFLRISIFRKAVESESSTMKAGFYHALADFSSTIIALLGFGLAVIGVYSSDALASIVLGILLIYLSVRLVWSSGMELTDTISKDIVKKIKEEIARSKMECKVENLGSRFPPAHVPAKHRDVHLLTQADAAQLLSPKHCWTSPRSIRNDPDLEAHGPQFAEHRQRVFIAVPSSEYRLHEAATHLHSKFLSAHRIVKSKDSVESFLKRPNAKVFRIVVLLFDST